MKLTQLPQISYTSLDYESIVEEIKQLVKENPQYNKNWDNFLESDAGIMFVEIMSYIVEKLVHRIDWIAKEMFVSTATQKQSLINILKLINYRPKLPRAAKVLVNLHLNKWVPSFSLNSLEKIKVKDTTGKLITFECLDLASDGKPNYDYIYTLNTGDSNNPILDFNNVPFYEGQTIVEDNIYMEGIDNESFILLQKPVIENSIRVYSLTTGKEFIEVSSFISPEAQQNDVADKRIPYMIDITAENEVIIKFGNSSLVDIPSKNERLKVIYRIGGGSNGNIVSNAIDYTRTYTFSTNRTTIFFSNPNSGFGGADSEDVFQARLEAPLKLRTANKTVTEEDYKIELKELDEIMKVNVIGKSNEPSTFYNDYGHYLPPLDTWLYIIPQRPSYTDYKPYEYNSLFKIGRQYNVYDIVDYEDIQFDSGTSEVYLTKYFKYKHLNLYVTLYEESFECTEYLMADSYIENTDYILDKASERIIRISTANGGNIPDGSRTLRVLYINQDSTTFKQKTHYIFSTDTITLSNQPNYLYPGYKIKIYNYKGEEVPENHYQVNYQNNTVQLINTTFINIGDKVIITYAGDYNSDTNSEDMQILDKIKNKKMICVDNYIKDSTIITYDIMATITYYKNMKTKVMNELKDHIRQKFNLETADYEKPITAAEIVSEILNFDGVKYVELNYLGKNYNFYRRYLLNEVDEDFLKNTDSVNYTTKIPASYKEILVLNDDEYADINSINTQTHGLIFFYIEG